MSLFGPPDVEKLKAVRDVKGLLSALAYKKSEVRCRAADALGELKDARAVEPLIVALKDEAAPVRKAAAEALGKFKDTRAVEPLIATLMDREVYVREAAAEALGKLKDARAVEPLITALKYCDPFTYLHAINISVILTGKVMEPRRLENLFATFKLHIEEVAVRVAIAEALGKFKDTRAVEPLIAALKNNYGNKPVRDAIAKALEKIGGPGVKVAALEDALAEYQKRESTPQTNGAPGQSYFFICSGNASLIDAYNNLFKVGALAYNGTAGHYYASVGNLDVRKQEASKASLPFVGQSCMGAISTPVSQMHEVLQAIGAEAGGEMHIAFVSVDQTGISWVNKVYNELLDQAVSQGIIPYEIYVTEDKNAAQFLLDSFEKIS
jgi:hypothetical protein